MDTQGRSLVDVLEVAMAVAEGGIGTLQADLDMTLVKASMSMSLLVLRYSYSIHDGAPALVILMQGYARLALCFLPSEYDAQPIKVRFFKNFGPRLQEQTTEKIVFFGGFNESCLTELSAASSCATHMETHTFMSQ